MTPFNPNCHTIILENDYMIVEIIPYAASVYQIYLKVNKLLKPVLSTPKRVEDFVVNTLSYGRTIGRTAGKLHKTDESSKYIDFNDELFMMHGGKNKFSTKQFSIDYKEKQSVGLSYFASNLSDGFLGNLEVKVTYELEGNNFVVKHEASTDVDSLCNITFHPYFNLDQSPNLLSHNLKINSSKYLGINNEGRFDQVMDVSNTHRDYTTSKPLVINDETKLDDIFMLNSLYACSLATKNIRMNVLTNYPSLVVYTQNKPTNTALSNALKDALHAGIAIETQKPQNKLPLLKKDEIYSYWTKYQFEIINS